MNNKHYFANNIPKKTYGVRKQRKMDYEDYLSARGVDSGLIKVFHDSKLGISKKSNVNCGVFLMQKRMMMLIISVQNIEILQ